MKTLLIFLGALLPVCISAQNLQLHYDLGEGRKYFTTTHEMFRPDTLGSTFWFIDFDFNFPGSPRSMSAAYWEISRSFFIPGLKKIHPFEELAVHFEYNDGFAAFESAPDEMMAASYNSVFLAGFEFPLHMGDFILTAQLLGRMPRGMNSPDFQLTFVWFQYLFSDRVLLTGYMDLWSQDKVTPGENKELIYQTEPQLWFLLSPWFAIGGELEISKNFPAGQNEWQFMQTVGVRWEF